MLFFLLILLPIVYLLIHSISQLAKEEATKANFSSSSRVESSAKKADTYLDLNNLDNVNDFSKLVYKYVQDIVSTYGSTISTRQPIHSLHTSFEEIIGHLNKKSSFSFKNYYVEHTYSSERKLTDVFYTNSAESLRHYRYHVVEDFIPHVFLSEDALKINKLKTYFINKDSDLSYLWDKLATVTESDNGFNDRYSSAMVYSALAIVLAIQHVIRNRLKENVSELLDDHLASLEIELDIAKAPKVCDKTLYCPTDGIQINSHTISKILNIFKRD